MKPASPFRRDFTLMVIGQIISLFGNAILRFSLSLHVLSLTGSAAVFGSILALAMVPTVLLSPLGGVLADRLPRQRIMVALDFLTCGLILCFDLFFARSGSLGAITAFLILLSLIQAVYQPSVQASIPSLAAEEALMAANGVVVQVQALSGLLGPILGGVLYAAFGLYPLLAGSALCFFASAVLELFLRIPFTPLARTSAPLAQLRRDLGDALRFLSRDNPRLLKLQVVVAGINLFLSSLFTVGLPYLVKVHLSLSDSLYGFAEAAMGMGSILGGLLSSTRLGRLGFEKSYRHILATVLLLLPAAAVLAAGAPAGMAYGVLIVCMALGMAFAALFSIAAQTFLQRATPAPLLGKVGSFVTTFCTCAMPAGQAMYGVLFDAAGPAPWSVVLLGAAATLVLVEATRRILRGVGGAGGPAAAPSRR